MGENALNQHHILLILLFRINIKKLQIYISFNFTIINEKPLAALCQPRSHN